VVLFLVHEKTNVARIVAQDQNGNALMEVASRLQQTCVIGYWVNFFLVQLRLDAHVRSSSIKIGAENITFPTSGGKVHYLLMLEISLLGIKIIRRCRIPLLDY
jgi:hypothetical protein